MIERIGAECEALDMPFFLEPVGYDIYGADVKSLEYAKRKPGDSAAYHRRALEGFLQGRRVSKSSFR